MALREVIPKVFGSIKTTMIDLFDEYYATVTKATVAPTFFVVVVARVQGRGMVKYQDFSNMKPP